jgi:carboxypeptidase T
MISRLRLGFLTLGFLTLGLLIFLGGSSAAIALGGELADESGRERLAGERKSLIRVLASDSQLRSKLLSTLRSWDVAGTVDAGRTLDLVVTGAELRELAAAGVPFDIVLTDVDQDTRDARAAYHSFPQVEDILSALAATYPAITQLTSLGQSYEGRDIWCLEISDNPGVDEGEPGVLFVGLHHAREWPSVEGVLDIANRLTTGYGSDPTITDLVNSRRIWLMPCVNPDGYVYCHDQGHDWRKNRHVFSQFGTVGVDLNRNYDGSVNGDKGGAWGSAGYGLSTHNPASEAYCGPGPFSELEMQAVRDFCMTHQVTIAITYHTYGRLVLWPWGYTSGATPDNALLASFGQSLANQISHGSDGTYTAMQSALDYATIGEMIDWTYGNAFYELGQNTLPYTIEMGASFHPSESQLQTILDANWLGALYALQQAADVAGQLTPYVLPPLLTTPGADADGDFAVSWQPQNPEAGVDHYELQELTGLTRSTDGAESGSAAWTLQGMSITTTSYHSGSHSFKSPAGDAQIAAMTTAAPLPVSADDEFSLWVWYDLESQRDMAFVEVSADGRQFDLLDKFTGQSGAWVQRTYSLAPYAGLSVYLRLRYTSDPSTTRAGFYADDIWPIPLWESIATLADDLSDTAYEIAGRTPGEYYYRVRGANPEHGVGDYCALSRTHVLAEPLLGDLNCDGAINGFDIDPFVLALTSPQTYGELLPDCDYMLGDTNGDGFVNGYDIDPFVVLLVGG